MKDRWHPTLTSYPIPTEIYGKLAELAGETYENNHSAYRLGSGKMQEKLFEKYPAATKEINAVFDSMIGVSAQDVIATKRVSVKVNALYKKVEPQKYAESIKRNDG
jgi:histidinol phosphatase-like enzyme